MSAKPFPLCRECKHIRPWPPAWIFLLPVIGQIFFIINLFDWDTRYRLAKCAVSFKDDATQRDKYLGIESGQDSTKYAGISREYGPCKPSGELFERTKGGAA